MSRRRLASFSSMWGTATGGIDVFNRDLIRALASLKEGPEICACLQVHGETLARDSTKYGFTAVTPGDNRSQPDAEFLEGWTLQQTQAVVLQMKLRHRFTPDIILLHDIFCKEALEVVREYFPDALVVTFFHSAYGRSEKKKHKPDSELERKARFQAEMIRDSDLSLSVGEFAESYLRSLVIDEGQSIGHVVPGRPQISPIRTKATHFNAISFGRLDPISDSIKQIRLSAKAWSEARKSEHLTGLKTSDVHFFAVGARGQQELLSIEKKAVKETWKAGILELPFEEVGDFDRSKLKAQMARCAFVLLNSWYENFGLTFLEACTAGVPTILSESSGFFHELKRILGEEEARRLTITTETDNRSEQEIVDDLKMKLIVGAQTYENVHKNAQELSSQIIRRWPSWEETARNLMLQVEGIRKALGKARVPDRPRRTAIDPQAQEEPTSETLDDLCGWCWQRNSPYFQRLLNESNIVSELRRPLTPLQKKFWDEREQLVSHNFKDLVLSGGTSSGKTTLAELLFGLSRPNEFARARILYIAPTKALAQERAASWSRRY